MTVDLHFATVAELGARYRTGDVSPVEVVNALLNRIDQRGDETKAFIALTAERARAEAQAAETLLRAGADLGPLHGIPIALKDLFHTAGIRTTSGAKAWDQFVPDTSATAAKRLSRAGAVLIGKTNMVELAFGPYGLNPPLRNAAQSLGGRPRAGRVEQWVGRGRGRGVGACGTGHGYGGIDSHPSVVLRCCGPQTHIGAGQPCGGNAAFVDTGQHRAIGAERGRRRAGV